ncbi:MAG: 50S ribosomal protein L11 methyltransferase [Defluviitaleaceae bacterium]|nr:50S ribosomal protein L11 methyltransferase [Defluviitaleaceae bacterium]
MKWTRTTITTTPEQIEELAAVLTMRHIEAFEIFNPVEQNQLLDEGDWDYVEEGLTYEGPAHIRFYLDEENSAFLTHGLADAVAHLGETEIIEVEDDWTDAWREFYKPFRIGERIIIRPHWEEYEALADDVVFTIDPGHVFGTGQHQSTALCIRMLEKYLQGGETLLDIGCGSGILSIIALLLGAEHATAIDIDPAATKMAQTNLKLNNIPEDRLTAIHGNMISDPNLVSGEFDIIVANIVADVIIKLVPIVKNILAPGGRFITGGVIDDRADDVEQALEEAGFTVDKHMLQDGWVTYYASLLY